MTAMRKWISACVLGIAGTGLFAGASTAKADDLRLNVRPAIIQTTNQVSVPVQQTRWRGGFYGGGYRGYGGYYAPRYGGYYGGYRPYYRPYSYGYSYGYPAYGYGYSYPAYGYGYGYAPYGGGVYFGW